MRHILLLMTQWWNDKARQCSDRYEVSPIIYSIAYYIFIYS